MVYTYAQVGKTPILKEHLSRDRLSAMSAITLDGKLYMIEQERSFKAEDALRFLKHLMRQIPGKLLISYGMVRRSIGEERSRISGERSGWQDATGAASLLYAPDLNPDEGISASTSSAYS